jgi:hypothetical protein
MGNPASDARPLATIIHYVSTPGVGRQEENTGAEYSPGSRGPRETSQMVAEAKAKIEEPMPDQEVGSISIPDVKTIPWITVQSASTVADSEVLEKYEQASEPRAKHLNSDAVRMPIPLHFDHITVSLRLSANNSVLNVPFSRNLLL